MFPFELQYFTACYAGNVNELRKLGTTGTIVFTFFFPNTSSYYFNTGRASITYSPLCILSLSYELWQFFRDNNWDTQYNATQECKKMEQCFELFGIISDAFEVDYHSMNYLKCSLIEGEEWFDDVEQQDLIKAGFKQADILLFNAAQKCDIELVKKLLQQGANPSINISDEQMGGDLFSMLIDDISMYFELYETYYEMCHQNKKLNDEQTRSMLCVLYDMASAARLLRLLNDYRMQYIK